MSRVSHAIRQYLTVFSDAVIASLKTKKEGVRILTLSFTGTTKEAEVARQKSREKEQSLPDGPSDSVIKDWTGSGEEHRPENDAKEVPSLPGSMKIPCPQRKCYTKSQLDTLSLLEAGRILST